MSCESSVFSRECVECQLSCAIWKPSRYFLRPREISSMNCSGVFPAFSAASMIGAPWASSAPMKCTSCPCMRWNRTQMSAWMNSMMWPIWNGPFAYGSAVVTNSRRDMLTFKKPSFYRLAPLPGALRAASDQDDRRRDDHGHDDGGGEDHVLAVPPRPLAARAQRPVARDRGRRDRPCGHELGGSVRADLPHQALGRLLRVEGARDALGRRKGRCRVLAHLLHRRRRRLRRGGGRDRNRFGRHRACAQPGLDGLDLRLALAQVVREIGGALVACLGRLGEHLRHYVVEHHRHLGVARARRG